MPHNCRGTCAYQVTTAEGTTVGVVYEGFLKNGLPHDAQGRLTMLGTSYVGNFENGRAVGQGTFAYGDDQNTVVRCATFTPTAAAAESAPRGPAQFVQAGGVSRNVVYGVNAATGQTTCTPDVGSE
jgi:hypothetical protein